MTDWGRLHRGLWRHPKWEQIDWAARGVWAHYISWSKDKKTAGLIPNEEVASIPELVEHLVRERMWLKVEGGYRYNDWENWNAHEKPRTVAGRLVEHVISEEYPSVVRQQLAAKVAELIEEGHEISILEAALKLWLAKEGAGVNLLPHLIPDVLRTRTDAGLEELLRRCWKTGNVLPLQAHGYIYEPLDPDPTDTVEMVRQKSLNHMRSWIESLQKDLK